MESPDVKNPFLWGYTPSGVYLPKRTEQEMIAAVEQVGWSRVGRHCDQEHFWVCPFFMNAPQIEYLLELAEGRKLRNSQFSTESLERISLMSAEELKKVMPAISKEHLAKDPGAALAESYYARDARARR